MHTKKDTHTYVYIYNPYKHTYIYVHTQETYTYKHKYYSNTITFFCKSLMLNFTLSTAFPQRHVIFFPPRRAPTRPLQCPEVSSALELLCNSPVIGDSHQQISAARCLRRFWLPELLGDWSYFGKACVYIYIILHCIYIYTQIYIYIICIHIYICIRSFVIPSGSPRV